MNILRGVVPLHCNDLRPHALRPARCYRHRCRIRHQPLTLRGAGRATPEGGGKYRNVPGFLRTGGVPQESTATGVDRGGLVRIAWDGDLR
jgi:hypothetical protein